MNMRTRLFALATGLLLLAACSGPALEEEAAELADHPAAESVDAFIVTGVKEERAPELSFEAAKVQQTPDPQPEPTEAATTPPAEPQGTVDASEPPRLDQFDSEWDDTGDEFDFEWEDTGDEFFDAEWAESIAGYIVEDITTADEDFLYHPGIGGATTMMFLTGNMDDLLAAGTPPDVDPAHYYATVTTLGEFFARAGDQLRFGDTMEATATYVTARGNTQELLDMLNPVLGTGHQLPPSPFE